MPKIDWAILVRSLLWTIGIGIVLSFIFAPLYGTIFALLSGLVIFIRSSKSKMDNGVTAAQIQTITSGDIKNGRWSLRPWSPVGLALNAISIIALVLALVFNPGGGSAVSYYFLAWYQRPDLLFVVVAFIFFINLILFNTTKSPLVKTASMILVIAAIMIGAYIFSGMIQYLGNNFG
jgi:hypothetical protein